MEQMETPSGTAAQRPPLHTRIDPVELERRVDAKECARLRGESLASWYAGVASGRYPAPAIKRPRFTRWRLGDVLECQS